MDPITLVMLAVLAVMVFFMFRNSKKRQKDQAELQNKMVPGAEVMTSFGLYGTLVSIDDDTNIAEIAVADGMVLRVHRQTLAKVVDDEVAPAAAVTGDADTAVATDAPVVTDVDTPVDTSTLDTPVDRKKTDD